MLKNLKQVIALILIVVMSFSLTACADESAADIADKVAAKLDSITSMDAKMEMQFGLEMQLDGQTQNMDTSSVANITSFNDPVQMKMDIHMKVDTDGQEQEIDMESYAVQEDGALAMYTKVFDAWQKQILTVEEQMESVKQYDAQSNLHIYLENTDSFKVSSEQLNGVEVYRLDGTLSGQSLREAIEASGTMEQLSQLSNGSEDLYASMFDNLKDMPVRIWANKSDLMPVRYEMDMTKTMQSMIDNLIVAQAKATGEAVPADFKMSIKNVHISMDMSNFNNATPIVVPQEALDSTK